MTIRTFRPTLFSYALLALPLLVACDDDEQAEEHADASPQFDAATNNPDAGAQAISLQFGAKVGGEDFSCSQQGAARTYSGVGSQASETGFKDFRFYVSNVRLLDPSGNEVAMTLTNDGAFQLQEGDQHVALLDFEDGTGSCSDTGNTPLNTTILGSVPEGTYTGVVFELGIPFTMNHLDVATAQSPLNIGALYWAWASGHKFMRVDYNVGGVPWNLHLGSTMCVSDGMTTPPTEECSRPNRATIRLENFDPSVDTIEFDAAAIVAQSDISMNLGDPTPGCMSFPHDEPDCTALYTALGMTYTSGVCTTDCSDQTAFRIAQ